MNKPVSRFAPKKPAKIGKEDSVVLNVTLSGPVYTRLNKMRIAKGCRHPQELARLFISDSLEKAGY